jgi:hypothetical protein
MEIDQLFGLPAHPLLVHMPVVFIPLTLLMAILAVAWSRGRKILSLVVAAGAAIGMVGAQVAVMSGKALEERVRETSLVQQHAEIGEGARTLAILMFLAAVAFVAREWSSDLRVRGAERLRQVLAPRAMGVVLSVALLASAGLSTVWIVRAGHLGAKATWNDLPATSSGAR